MNANLNFAKTIPLTLEQRAEAEDAVFGLVYRQLKMETAASPGEIEDVVALLDSGVLDEALNRVLPQSHHAVPRKPRMFADLPVFDDAKWEARRS